MRKYWLQARSLLGVKLRMSPHVRALVKHAKCSFTTQAHIPAFASVATLPQLRRLWVSAGARGLHAPDSIAQLAAAPALEALGLYRCVSAILLVCVCGMNMHGLHACCTRLILLLSSRRRPRLKPLA